MVWLDIFLSISLPFAAFGVFVLIGQWFLSRAQNKIESSDTAATISKDYPRRPDSYEPPGQPGWESALAREEVRLRLKERG
jgi:hypothetical protein